MSEITPNELKIMFEDFNKRTDEKFNDREKKNDERHEVYKEERKEIKAMLQEINVSLKKLSDDHADTDKNVTSLFDWSVTAKKVIESNSENIADMKKKMFLFIGGASVILAIGVWVLTLWEKNLRQDILKENGDKTYEVVQKVLDERVKEIVVDKE